MGIFVNVLMEEPAHGEPWVHTSPEGAFADIECRLGQETRRDELLRDPLHRRLRFEDGRYVWPQDLRTAPVFWRVESEFKYGAALWQ